MLQNQKVLTCADDRAAERRMKAATLEEEPRSHPKAMDSTSQQGSLQVASLQEPWHVITEAEDETALQLSVVCLSGAGEAVCLLASSPEAGSS